MMFIAKLKDGRYVYACDHCKTKAVVEYAGQAFPVLLQDISGLNKALSQSYEFCNYRHLWLWAITHFSLPRGKTSLNDEVELYKQAMEAVESEAAKYSLAMKLTASRGGKGDEDE